VDITQVFNFFFSQYLDYTALEFYLELTGVIFGVLSVWFAKKNNIIVFPTGLISTGIYVYLLFKWSLLGDLLINIYFFLMGLYGWYFWNKKTIGKPINFIKSFSNDEQIKVIILVVLSLIFVTGLYTFFEKWNSSFAWVDTFTTSLFFAGMWLMARRKIEHWIFWIIGDIISVPLYFYKGHALTSIQYLIFTILAIQGYREWKIKLNKKNQTV